MDCTSQENEQQISVWFRCADGFMHEMKYHVRSKVVIYDLYYKFLSFFKLKSFFVQHINVCNGIINSWTATKKGSLKNTPKRHSIICKRFKANYRLWIVNYVVITPCICASWFKTCKIHVHIVKTIQNSIAKPSPFWRFYKRFIWCLCALKAVWKCKQTMLNDRF